MLTYLVFDRSHEDILREEQCNLIISFAAVKRKLDMQKYFEYIPYLPNGFPKILIDSGGYQLQTGVRTAMRISIDNYIAWLKPALEKYPEISGYFNLDVMGDIDTTLDNMKRLEGVGLNPIPVWHPGEGDWILEYYVNEYDYVALGGLVGKGKMHRYTIRNIFERMATRYPNKKFHILGMGITASSALRTFRPYSVDYSTWVNSYKFGMGLFWDKDELLREHRLPQDVRDRIRIDKDFKRTIVRDAIKKIKEFSFKIDNMNDPYQTQMDFRI